VGVVVSQSCEHLPFVDGCSHTPNFIKKFMAEACVRHDICYGCVNTFFNGLSKSRNNIFQVLKYTKSNSTFVTTLEIIEE
jgi:hypothetical protein